ncbi:hypothetical protein GH714_031535 [Hevea brasiliensis]|uniref:DUF4216 domain-containing protein n=1 Tax=Hevea brasiliensis TaxID=3981 RepID=A0A6A6LKS9_HEVBR|nr:hypothetical protein GH714_031535 [Hevea brasiliensis]
MSRVDNNSPDKEYYGTLMDVWELQYSERNQISLFKCEWFDVRHKETGYIVMARVSKRKKNNRKMPPGLKSWISSAHGDSSEETLPPSQSENLSDFVRPEEESGQSLRTNIENDPVGVSNAPSLSSPASNVVGCLASGRGLYKGIDLDKLTNGKKDKLIIFIPLGKYF